MEKTTSSPESLQKEGVPDALETKPPNTRYTCWGALSLNIECSNKMTENTEGRFGRFGK